MTKLLFWLVVFPAVCLLVLVLLLVLLLAVVMTGISQLVQVPFKLLSTAITAFLRGLVEQKKKDVNVVFTVSGERK
jgi:hypothetical protein